MSKSLNRILPAFLTKPISSSSPASLTDANAQLPATVMAAALSCADNDILRSPSKDFTLLYIVPNDKSKSELYQIKRYPLESPETIMPEAEGYPWVVWEEETSEYEGLFLPTYFATRSEATNYIKRFWDGTARLKLTREYKVR